MTAAPIMIMAGGTGGHVFPGLALADELRARSTPVVWLGTRRGLEARLVPAAGIPIEWIQVSGLRGKGVLAWVLAPLRLLHALYQCIKALLRWRPAAVIGLGGFVSGPGGIAAWLLRKPLVIHEQNAVAGLTNRILARFAAQVLEAFPGSFAVQVAARRIGNPVRRAILATPEPTDRLTGRTGALRVLVFGGSQGASRLNQVLPEALAAISAGERPEVWHQTGAREAGETEALYRRAGITARLEPFIDDMATAYAWADVVVSRAGALTVFELAAAGVASILVPYPHAVDDHQTRNAEYLVNGNAAIHIPESELTAYRLATELTDLARDRQRVLAMASLARRLATPDAATQLTESCLAAARRGESL